MTTDRVFEALSSVRRANMIWLGARRCSLSVWGVSKPHAPDSVKVPHGLQSKIVAYMPLTEQ